MPEIAKPGVVLVAWTLVMYVWLLVTRFRGMARSGIDVRTAAPGGRGQDLERVLPARTNWVAHNVTHLHEQPTLFYALVALLALAGANGPVPVALAWVYAVSRIVHSVWQATVNRVSVRFALFLVGTLCLFALAFTALAAAFF